MTAGLFDTISRAHANNCSIRLEVLSELKLLGELSP